MKLKCILLGMMALGFWAVALHAGDAKPVKVFLLVGQSNMQGKGSLEHLDKLVKEEPEKYGHLKKDGKWIERDDVFVIFPSLGGRDKDQKGKLSVGYTWPPKVRVGLELSFGEVVGDAFEEPVVLLKCCWGGQSLDVDFRPPSAGWGDRRFDLNNRVEWKPASVGWAYQQIFNNIHIAFDDLGANIPELKGRPYDIAGLVWFQGWNDLIDGKKNAAYKDNLVHFIHDIRKHLDKPKLPIVIGVMGQDGDKPNDAMKKIREAQTAPAEMEEFKGNVVSVPTAQFYDPTVKYDGGYHDNGSARYYYEAGKAIGQAMVKLAK